MKQLASILLPLLLLACNGMSLSNSNGDAQDGMESTHKDQETTPAYLILNFTIEDREPYAEYSKGATEAWNIGVPFEIIVADRASENLEGEPGELTLIFKFQSKEDAKKIYDSDAYRDLITKRLAATSHHFGVLVDGYRQ